MAFAWPSAAQFHPTAHDARSAAMGGCYLPAMQRSVAIGYRQSFLLASMAERQAALWLPIGVGAVDASYWYRGSSDYHEQRLEAGYGLPLASWLSASVVLAYLNVGTADPHYPSQHWLAADARVVAALSSALSFTLNAGSRPWDKEGPWRAMLQMVYRYHGGWTTVLQADSEERLRLRAGVEYLYRQQLAVRAGLSTAPLALTFGTGLVVGAWRFDLSVEAHSRLGVSPHTTLTLCF